MFKEAVHINEPFYPIQAALNDLYMPPLISLEEAAVFQQKLQQLKTAILHALVDKGLLYLKEKFEPEWRLIEHAEQLNRHASNYLEELCNVQNQFCALHEAEAANMHQIRPGA